MVTLEELRSLGKVVNAIGAVAALAYLAAFFYEYENLFALYDKGRGGAGTFENALLNVLPLFKRPAARRAVGVGRGHSLGYAGC